MARGRKAASSQGAPALSDDALALEFAESHSSYLRLCLLRQSWMSWDGMRWRPDRATVREAIRRICRKAALEAEDPSLSLRLASAAKVAAVESLARTDNRLVMSEENWDADPWLLNTPGGVVELRSGKVMPHDPDLSMTHLTAALPGGEAPRWHTFIDEITGGDTELRAYLQRVAGYCLTGSTREQAIFYLLGSGANGKSVFTSVLATILGGYATTAASDLLAATSTARHPTDIAVLNGRRLVLVAEMERRARFAESRMKALTGGDEIAARLMRQDFFTFIPRFKLLITGNQMPALDGADEAARRRLQIVPFRWAVPAEKRDSQLIDALLQERDGILAWAIEGCLAWQAEGLRPPALVREASADYLHNQDTIGRFLLECCEAAPPHAVGSTELFRRWCAWTHGHGEQEGSQRSLVQELQARGFAVARSARRREVRGLRLKPEPGGAGENRS
jgi:putative DNA primase/helicase